MEHLKLIRSYLKEHREHDEIPATGFPFITISREAGAGGHLLAHVLVTDFLKESGDLFKGWHVFDKELCELMAADPEIASSMDHLMAETYPSEFDDFLQSLFTGKSKRYTLIKKTFRLVHMLATLGKVILVGRAAAFVTQGMAGGIHCRLVASAAQRTQWMMKKLKVPENEAARLIKKQDAEKAKIVKQYFNQDIHDPAHYDTVWNSERANPHEIAHAIIGTIRYRHASAG